MPRTSEVENRNRGESGSRNVIEMTANPRKNNVYVTGTYIPSFWQRQAGHSIGTLLILCIRLVELLRPLTTSLSIGNWAFVACLRRRLPRTRPGYPLKLSCRYGFDTYTDKSRSPVRCNYCGIIVRTVAGPSAWRRVWGVFTYSRWHSMDIWTVELPSYMIRSNWPTRCGFVQRLALPFVTNIARLLSNRQFWFGCFRILVLIAIYHLEKSARRFRIRLAGQAKRVLRYLRAERVSA